MYNHTGTETRSRLFVASSEEYWTMNESLIQQYYVNERQLIFGCKVLSLKMIMTLFKEVLVPANLVPAAAVIREGQALFVLTGRIASVDCIISYILKFRV